MAQYYADGVDCLCCGASFSDRSGLLRHLRRPTGACLGHIMASTNPLDHEAVAAWQRLDQQAAVDKRTRGLRATAPTRPALP
eukprot:1784419-Pyramimonas_sp.AAC.1